jgi:hypothetical protein
MKKSLHLLTVLVALGILLGCTTVSFGQGGAAHGYSEVSTDKPKAIASATLRPAPPEINRTQNNGASAPTPCAGENLSVKRVSDDAGLGNRAVNYAFTNTSTSPCTLSGSPGFVLLNRGGQSLHGTHIVKATGTYFQPEESPQTVTLPPGGTAWFQIAYRACQGRGMCPVSAKVRITAPGTKRGFILSEQIEAFQGTVNVIPVRSGLPPQQ